MHWYSLSISLYIFTADEKKTRARSRKSEKKEKRLLQYNARMDSKHIT